jgi:uncharacterized protein YuzE
MADTPMIISYDPEWDALEITWNKERKPTYGQDTDNDRVTVFVDMEGNVQGLLINGLSKITEHSKATNKLFKLNIPFKEHQQG